MWSSILSGRTDMTMETAVVERSLLCRNHPHSKSRSVSGCACHCRDEDSPWCVSLKHRVCVFQLVVLDTNVILYAIDGHPEQLVKCLSAEENYTCFATTVAR